MIQAKGRWIQNHETNYWETSERCVFCNAEVEIALSDSQFRQYMHGSMNIQDIRPQIDIDTREMLISGICPACFPTEEDE